MDVVELLERLVATTSVNPALDAGSAGEGEVAALVARELHGLGLEVTFHDVLDGRQNVVAVLTGSEDAPTLLLEAHMDTVAHPESPLAVEQRDGCLYGRGACDTKGSLAGMLAALADLVESGGPHATVVLAAVADEEAGMRGSKALLHQLPLPVDGAVVGEPTSLRPVRAHNGAVRVTLCAEGRSAHTSKAHLGVNAILVAARAVLALDERVAAKLAERPHELTGPALLTASVIAGGTAANVVPDRCEVWLDRRLAPGEEPADALAELEAALEEVRAGGDSVRLGEPWVSLHGVETPADHPIVRTTEDAASELSGERVQSEGVPYGTDASRLSGEGGIPCVVLGPGSIDQAHTDDEWVSVDEVRRAAELYAAIARRAAASWPAGDPSTVPAQVT